MLLTHSKLKTRAFLLEIFIIVMITLEPNTYLQVHQNHCGREDEPRLLMQVQLL